MFLRTLLIATALALAADVRAAEPQTANPPDRAAIERKVRVALALAEAGAPKPSVVAVAPVPHVKPACPCGTACVCCPGDCPQCCPVAAIKDKEVPAVMPVVKPVAPQPVQEVWTFIGYTNGLKTYRVCNGGVCRTVYAQ